MQFFLFPRNFPFSSIYSSKNNDFFAFESLASEETKGLNTSQCILLDDTCEIRLKATQICFKFALNLPKFAQICSNLLTLNLIGRQNLSLAGTKIVERILKYTTICKCILHHQKIFRTDLINIKYCK